MAAQGEADYLNRREMQARGIEIAKTEGKYRGRMKQHDDAAIASYVGAGHSWTQAQQEFSVSRSAVARAMRAAKATS